LRLPVCRQQGAAARALERLTGEQVPLGNIVDRDEDSIVMGWLRAIGLAPLATISQYTSKLTSSVVPGLVQAHSSRAKIPGRNIFFIELK